MTSILPKIDWNAPSIKPNADPFLTAVAFTLKHEGGHLTEERAKQLRDKGGETKYGISKASYPELDIANLTEEEAVAIYRRDYWERIRGDELPLPVAFAAFDYAVNSGPGMAHRAIRQAVGLPQRGGLTPQVLRRLKSANPVEVTRSVLKYRADHIALLSRQQPQFASGWQRRVIESAYVSGRLARGQAEKANAE